MGDVSAISTPTGGTECPEVRCDTPSPPDVFEGMFGYSRDSVPLVRGDAQNVEHTAARRSGPRRWLRAVVWLVAARLHPRAGATTQRVAEDLAARMDYDTGHARYCLTETAARLGIDPSTVKRHVAVLRELGALAWVVHGTRTNIRRALGLKGYAGTATVYAATIPAAYDRALGHIIVGTGYTARILIDQRGEAGRTTDAPPSLTVVKESPSPDEVDGFKDTSRKRASRSTAPISPSTPKDASNGNGQRRPVAQVARDIWIARQVRPRVSWTQGEGLRRLAYALRPLIDQGLEVHDIVAELSSWWLSWRPSNPAAYIRVQLAKTAVLEAVRDATAHPGDNPQWAAAGQQLVADWAPVDDDRPRTDEDRRQAQIEGFHRMHEVVAHLEDFGADDCIDLYGVQLTALAARMDSAAAVSTLSRW